MIVTIVSIILFFIGFVTSVTFDLSVFNKQASDFIISFIAFAAVLVICSAILNISLSIGIIADSKVEEVSGKESSFINKQFYMICLVIVVAFISFLFIGDFISRYEAEKNIVYEANDLIKRYDKSIDKIANSISDTSETDEIIEILYFLSQQKDNFQDIRLIQGRKKDGQLVFFEIVNYDHPEDVKDIEKKFYKCSKKDCEYLENFFEGKTTEQYFWTEDSEYKLYSPFVKNGHRFVLLFSEYQRYGKIGTRM